MATTARGSAAAQNDISRKWQHWWAAAEVDIGLQLRAPVASAYMEHSVGVEGNAQLLEDISMAIKKRQEPWTLGGD